jgi:TolA-binding protein
MEKNIPHIFSAGDHIPDEVLIRYAEGSLSPGEAHRVERHTLECEICNDVLEGLLQISPPENIRINLSDLTVRVNERLSSSPRIIPLWRSPATLSVAAGLALVLGLSWFLVRNTDLVKTETALSENFSPLPTDSSLRLSSEQNNQEITSPDKNRTENIKPPSVSDNLDETISREGDVKSLSDEPSDDFKSSGPPSPPPVLSETGKSVESDKSPKGTFSGGVGNNKSSDPDLNQKRSKELEKEKQELNKPVDGPKKDANLKTDKITEVNIQDEEKSVSRSEKTTPGKKQKSANNDAPNYSPVQSSAPQPEISAPEKFSTGTIAPLETLKDSVSTGDNGFGYYNQQNYALAIKEFESQLKLNPNDEKARLYCGVSYLSMGKPAEGLVHLNKILSNKKSPYYQDAQWYSGMAQLQQKETKKARKTFRTLSDQPGKYQEKSKNVLKSLE